jgi:hypothetical protein
MYVHTWSERQYFFIILSVKTETQMTNAYHKRCPLFGLDFGFGPFSKKEYTSEEMSEYCGYDTTFDSTVGKCVRNEVGHCDTIDLTGLTTYEDKSRMCESQACSGGFGDKCNTPIFKCDVSGDDNAQRTACDANPGCKWDPENIMSKCISSNRGVFASGSIRADCGSAKIRIHELCGDGTTYDSFGKVCSVAS